MSFGEALAKLRKQRGWSQQEFADKIGVHNRHISRWETNRSKPRPKTLERIASAFEIPVNELVQEEGRKYLETILHDQDLVEYLPEIEKMDEGDKLVVKKVIQALLVKKQMQNLMSRVS